MATEYKVPILAEPAPPKPNEIVLVTSGDLRHTANVVGWAEQQVLEQQIADALAEIGYTVRRGHEFDPEVGHGFIWNQRMGMDVFADIHPDTPVIIAEAVWEYSHHVLSGLKTQRGPILTAANWSGTWPGLVGLLNLNASMTKANIEYSTIWSVDFTDEWARSALQEWARTGKITSHDAGHVKALDPATLPTDEAALGRALAAELQQKGAIMGIFDEGCMGMYNAIFDDEYINPLGIFKERLSQSALYYRMTTVLDSEAEVIFKWLVERGVTFDFGPDPDTNLTRDQVLQQCKMYIAALRIADEFGCAGVGIQYQQGLKDLVPASDLAEGLLNEQDRPPAYSEDGRELYPGQALPHFNEVDWGCGVDALITNRVWTAMGLNPSTTLHDVRWGDQYGDDFVWVMLISGSVPPSHLVGGYAGVTSQRQPPMYFRLGGGTIKGVSKPGPVVYSRVFLMDDQLHVDLGLGEAVELPEEETERRWQATTPQWPIMHLVTPGMSRDQFMARHKSNHIQVVYAPDKETATKALAAKAAMFDALGVKVSITGDVDL
jgi:hypothetical protein